MNEQKNDAVTANNEGEFDLTVHQDPIFGESRQGGMS